jgi:hypothetical protein
VTEESLAATLPVLLKSRADLATASRQLGVEP